MSGRLAVGEDHIGVALQRVEVMFGKSIAGLGLRFAWGACVADKNGAFATFARCATKNALVFTQEVLTRSPSGTCG